MTHRTHGHRRLFLATVSIVALLVTACDQESGTDGLIGQTQNQTNGTTTVETGKLRTEQRPETGPLETFETAMSEEADALAPSSLTRQSMQPGALADHSLSYEPTPPPQPMPQAGDINRERYEEVDMNGVMAVANQPVSTFSIDVDTASYGIMRRYLRDGALPPRDAIRPEEVINYFSYGYAAPENPETPFATSIAVTPTPWNTDTRLLHIGIQGYDIVAAERPSTNLVFLVDVSGSMSDVDKLPLLKRALKLLVNEMGPDDRISIVTYAGQAGTLLGATPGNEHARIDAAIDSLGAGGSTAGAAGIQAAYNLAEQSFIQDGVNRIILATDGDFNVGIADPARLEDFVSEKRETDIYLSVLGFGRGNYHDEMMQKLSQAGNGNAAYIDTLQEARKVLVDEIGSTLFTIADDVKIQVEFNPARVREYRLIGYETRALRREDFNNDAVDAGDIGAGHTVTAIYEIVETGSEGGMLDPLRYQQTEDRTEADLESEFAFLRIRYKTPTEDESQLIEQVVDNSHVHAEFAAAPQYARFAASAAAFAQKLKAAPYLSEFTYDQIAEIAASARGEDPFGYRNEFLQLIRLAESADALPPQGGYEASWLK